jgi:hypothetical protein
MHSIGKPTMSKDEKDKVTYAANSPLIAETLKSPIKEITHHNYGVRRLKQRCHKTKAKINSRH